MKYTDHLYNFDNYDSLLYNSERAVFKTVYKFLKLNTKDRILDVGCGTGAFRTYYSKISNYVGIDISKPNLAYIPKEFKHYLNMDATYLGFKSASFTKVICCEVLEHVEEADRSRILKEIKRVVKPNSQVVITVPNALYLWSYLPWSLIPFKRRSHLKDLLQGILHGFFDEGHPQYKPHYRFVPAYFSKLLISNGFKIDQITTTYWYNNRFLKYIPEKLQVYLWKCLVGWKLGSQIVISCKVDQ